MFESYTGSSGVILDAIRTLFSWLDRAAFGLLEFFYQLFFNVASADLFSNDTIMKFYGRVQLIIGVYMMFMLAMTILRGIMNPDDFFGGKDGGSGSKLITRIMTALIMLTVLVPINIGSPRNEYETQIHNNGLLFGTLYSLQHRILANNTLGRLILGNDSTSTSYFSSEGEDTLKQSSRIFTSTVLKGFYRINLKEEDDRTKHEDGKDDAIFNENRVCEDIDDEVLAAYTRVDANPGDIIGMINATCEVDDDSMSLLQKALSLFSPKLAGKQRYVFTMMPLVSTITAIIFAVILLSFSIDIAVRAVKLAVLRLIAPIPIISYMDPKGGKDGAFNSWVKTLTSTYLDLFIRLAVVYFVIFLIQDMIVNGVVINHGTGVVGILSLIIIWIGLFAFAKQAPKFIKDVLGMKGDAGKLFSGFGTAMGVGGAIGAIAGGTVGSTIAGARASRLADEERHKADPTYNPNSLLNRGKHAAAGIFGGIGGIVTGTSAAMNAKDHSGRAAFDAISKRNASTLSAGRNGGTFFGAVGSDIRQMVTGESTYDAMDAGWKASEQRVKNAELELKRSQDNNAHRKSIMDRAKSKATDCTTTTGTYGGITGNYRDFHSVYTAAIQQGVGVTTNAAGEKVFNYNGQEVKLAQAQSIDLGLLDANTANFYEQVVEFERTGGASGIDDNSILADRAAYRTATGGDLEAVFGGATGLKATYGNEANSNKAESDRLNRERADINNQRQGYQSQRAQADAKRFHQK